MHCVGRRVEWNRTRNRTGNRIRNIVEQTDR